MTSVGDGHLGDQNRSTPRTPNFCATSRMPHIALLTHTQLYF